MITTSSRRLRLSGPSAPRISLGSGGTRREPVLIHDATEDDNAALVELARSCPMEGDVALCVDRSPDFFALNRLEGGNWRVGVAGGFDDTPVGCIAVTNRTVYLHGRAVHTGYVSDFKVHPAYRGAGVADVLEEYARGACAAALEPTAPTMMTILAGNAPMEYRATGPRGLPTLTRFATIEAAAIPLIGWRAPEVGGDVRVASATGTELEEMAALWRRVARQRQFAPVHDATSLARWIERAPGLSVGDYLLARRRDGRLAGFLALWDQRSFKQLRVTGYSRRLGAFRIGFNALAPVLRAAPLPPTGDPIRCLTALHVCVPAGEPEVLRALLAHAYRSLCGRGYSFFTIGLDVRDPLRSALDGFLAQPTAVDAYVSTATGRYVGAALDDRPLHHEIALV
jgi:GNAT superfamily N-acetyltransferase